MAEEISRLNNEAAICIVNRQYDQSILLLRRATILISRSLMALPPPPRADCKNEVSGSSSSPVEADLDFYGNGDNFCKFINHHNAGASYPSSGALDSCFLTKESFIVNANTTTPRMEATTSASNSFFSAPIVIIDETNLRRNDTGAFLERLSYVLVYNLAIAHHCMATRSCCGSCDGKDQAAYRQALQIKALALYENSYQLLESALITNQSSRGSTSWNVSVLHFLSIICNLGHLHSMMNQQEACKQCYQRLLSMIILIVETRTSHQQKDGNRNDILLTKPLLDGFFRNAILPFLPDGCIAAAA